MIPPRRVLAAVDFSAGSQAALGIAARLARHCGAELHVLHAVAPSLVAAATARGADLRAEMCDELHRRVAATTAAAPIAAVHYHVIEGEAASVILHIAQRERADLIVLGKQGLSDVDWPALGGTLEDILGCTPTSLLVVPATWSPGCLTEDDMTGVGPVIAGVSMTCPSIEAAAAGCRLATSLHTEAILLHAVPPPQTAPRWKDYADVAAEQAVATSTQDVERAVSPLRAQACVPASLVFERGSVARVLAQYARAHPDGIIVLGRGALPHAYGPPGSIVARTLTLGAVPVLVHIGD